MRRLARLAVPRGHDASALAVVERCLLQVAAAGRQRSARGYDERARLRRVEAVACPRVTLMRRRARGVVAGRGHALAFGVVEAGLLQSGAARRERHTGGGGGGGSGWG